MRRHNAAQYRLPALAIALGAVVALLAGCTSTASSPATTPATPANSSASTSTTTAAPAPLALDPAGNAEANLDYFILVAETLLNGAPDSGGREVIDALVAGGFDKAEMEVTPDTTAVGLDADNIQFSVRINGDCLIGQSGNVRFHALAAPLLASGTCLVGKTRAIDW